MAPSRSSSWLWPATLSLAYLAHPIMASFECTDIGTQGQHFNFKSLGGPHVVHWQYEDENLLMLYKYNFTLDLCNRLQHHKGGCHTGSRVCGMREDINLAKEDNSTVTAIDIAGTYTTYNGRDMDPKFELLRDSKSNSDAGREGIRLTLNGGRSPLDDKKNGIDQRAILEFVCDKERTGLEGDEKAGDGKGSDDDDKDDDEKEKSLARRTVAGKGQCEDNDNSLRFCGYELESVKDKKDKVHTLRLEWRTKYACEDAKPDDGGSGSSSHWGFFGWFFIILFLAIATYLIFGSWLNYNRYGARGWDLLPHGDTIRDIPYIAKDFARKVVGTVQGGGSRGGYAAV